MKRMFSLLLVVFMLWVPLSIVGAQTDALNPLEGGKLGDPNSGLFTHQSSSQIRFPNLITSFTSGDFVNDLFKFSLDLLTTIGGVIAFGYMLYGGVKFITSGGNPAAVEEGKKIIIGSIVGIIIVAFAYVLVVYVRTTILELGAV